MNCKPGDIAVVISPGDDELCPPFIGTVLKVVKASNRWENCWVTEPTFVDSRDGLSVHINDKHLLPIRDTPGADETLDWKDVPKCMSICAQIKAEYEARKP